MLTYNSPRDKLDRGDFRVRHLVVAKHARVVVHVRHARLDPRVVRVTSIARLPAVEYLQ